MSLETYIETYIIPQYDGFDKAHWRDHVISVIERSVRLAEMLGMDSRIAYAAAAFHDLGLAEGRETHHIASGRIIRRDKFLPQWFTSEQIETIAQAAEDHRASAKNPPRSIYGKILAEADRDLNPDTVISRCVQFELSHNPDLPKDEQIRNVIRHLHEKYGRGGYVRLFIPGSENERNLNALWKILDSPDDTIKAVRKKFDLLK